MERGEKEGDTSQLTLDVRLWIHLISPRWPPPDCLSIHSLSVQREVEGAHMPQLMGEGAHAVTMESMLEGISLVPHNYGRLRCWCLAPLRATVDRGWDPTGSPPLE